MNRELRKGKMVESKQSYEECRRKRIEENKKRMEELNLGKLALAFKASTTPKSSPVSFTTLSLSLTLCVFLFSCFSNFEINCFLDFVFCTDRWSDQEQLQISLPYRSEDRVGSPARPESEPPKISHTTNLLQNHPSSDSSPPTRTRLPSSKLTFPRSNKWSKCSPDPPIKPQRYPTRHPKPSKHLLLFPLLARDWFHFR